MTKHCGQSAHYYEGLLFLALTIFSPTVFVGCGGSGGAATSATVDTGTVVGRIVPEAGVVLVREHAGRESKIVNGNNARAYVFPSNTNARDLVPSNSAPSSTVDDGGNYTIANVPAGEVIIVVDYDNDGIADEREFNIEVAKGQTTNAGTTEVSKLNKDPKGSWCDVMLDKNSYNTGVTCPPKSGPKDELGTDHKNREVRCDAEKEIHTRNNHREAAGG